MSHRKIHSQGSIPFSWEDKPGISRLPAQECPLEKGLHALNLESSVQVQPARAAASCDSAEEILKIPLPPCPSQQPPRRSTSLKGITGWWQEDPFFAAYKECTKKSSPPTSVGSRPNKKKKNKKSSKFVFSCKSTCEIRDDDNFVRLPNLPPLPKERIRTIR